MFNPFWDYTEPEPILREVFSDIGDPLSTCLFAQIRLAWQGGDHEADVPWGDSVDDEVLDMEYLLNHSGGKFCAPIIKSLLERGGTYVNEDGTLSTQSVYILAKIIVGKYKQNWQRLWDTNVSSYSPIHNYDMYEERDLATTEDETIDTDGTLARSGTESTQYGRVETVGHGRTNEQMSYKYGINTDTSDPKPSDKVNNTEGGTTTTTLSGTDTDTRNLTDTTDETRIKDNDGTEHEEIHRYGNIGVTTTQKLLQEERQLWLWNYFDQIFSDLDKELALAFHDPCRV
ncbi:MAG: hypothetical protein LIR46_03375 [Bacteroidota bacterium]|nr:hypothetical protein [Bacteroidota bacterium]